jgi:hypothetical protein
MGILLKIFIYHISSYNVRVFAVILHYDKGGPVLLFASLYMEVVIQDGSTAITVFLNVY